MCRQRGVGALRSGALVEQRAVGGGHHLVLEQRRRRLRAADTLHQIEKPLPARRCVGAFRSVRAEVRRGAIGNCLQDRLHLVDADLVDDLLHHPEGCVVTEPFSIAGPIGEVGVAPVVQRHPPRVVRGDLDRCVSGAAQLPDGEVRVHLREPFVQPAVGEPVAVEPRVRHLVQHDFLIEVLADLNLVLGGAEPPCIAVDVRRRGLAYGDGGVDRPRNADESLQFGDTLLDLRRDELLPLDVARP
ncbi:unannotated protein [freshwater metagenome]|uniref:Unannotated protein n=1 Tax=freshwater metagenome TaxID=449393 RepID=A0A6J7QU25_9ZZZZ